MTTDKRNAVLSLRACPVCGSLDVDEPMIPPCPHCEVNGCPLEDRSYVAVDALPLDACGDGSHDRPYNTDACVTLVEAIQDALTGKERES